VSIETCAEATPVSRVWGSLRALHDHQISHGDLRGTEITVDDGTVRFGGFGSAEFGASDVQLQSDIARLVVTTIDLYDARSAASAAIAGMTPRKTRQLRSGSSVWLPARTVSAHP
jgi:glycosyltransferase 2 family protein